MTAEFEETWARSLRRDAERVERIGDRLPNHPATANDAYRLAREIRLIADAIDARRRASDAERELRARELHHFETEQENAELRAKGSRNDR